ncbi:MAG: ABC transporter permease [Pirellulales bacterium]|jgi:putative ABC transport system permease protein|nr:ABC transporter permease [Pirellulales bacterium]MDA7991401.1 ABC transporter permease [Pirellulales bacterium]MDA8041831.1 ABC transporter permease [Pirellulales bacterium]MEE2797537.1 FtsX-like permease family protein [Planctomycetota bacterium]
MSLLGIAWRNIKQRALPSGLTALSMALGVALVVATLITGGVVKQAFESGAGLGYNMIVGAKGSPLQLVLNSVYFISKPIENISWATYAEFLPAHERPDGKDGTWAASTQTAVPICMGDYFRGHRVVGTNSAYFDRLTRGNGEPFEFSSGENFHDDDLYSAVLGSQVARTLNLRVGDTIAPTHGADDGKVHDPFEITGILSRTDTPIDRGVFVNMEGFYLQEGHAKPIDSSVVADQTIPEENNSPGDGLLPFNQREVTAILLETAALPGLPAELTAMGLRNAINEGREAQAALPIAEIRVLLDLFVTPLELLLLLVTTLVVIVSAIGILVSMVGSSLERSRDVAIMRALGARRSVVLATVLIEAILLAVGGGVIGLLLGHGTVGLIGPWIATNAGVTAGFLSHTTAELLLVPFLIVLAILAALLPAVAAYRTDVARWLN